VKVETADRKNNHTYNITDLHEEKIIDRPCRSIEAIDDSIDLPINKMNNTALEQAFKDILNAKKLNKEVDINIYVLEHVREEHVLSGLLTYMVGVSFYMIMIIYAIWKRKLMDIDQLTPEEK